MARRSNRSTESPPGETRSVAQRILTDYLEEIRATRSTGSGVPETSYYPALANLFNTVGATLKPKVRCVIHTRDRGAGIPDGGLFTAEQFDRQADHAPNEGQLPARGAIEAKAPDADVTAVAGGPQVRGYLREYGIVVVTNLRDFLILERGPAGQKGSGGREAPPAARESFSLAADAAEFWSVAVAHPRAAARRLGGRFFEFIKRACLHAAPLARPRDVAWFLASYARDGLARVEEHRELPALQQVRAALEEALGMKFTQERGEHFFRSTLVQTLFYGVFAAWVIWSRSNPAAGARFDWRAAGWSLHVPFIRTLYEAVATAGRLGPLGLVDVLDWSAGVLNRVDRAEFFRSFEEDSAVQYFYEPFLEAYDPQLRKDLGVWYTPPEIVKYQVARVDAVLREELGVSRGLADPDVIVLDPCCGTGAYLVEVLRQIERNDRAENGSDGMIGYSVKTAAMNRVFGFEILPAPFVIAHLQIGLLLRRIGVPLATEKSERAGVYLTNALTGWEPPKGPKQHLMAWVELEQESDAAERVKRENKILVVLGNPPYNAFAGVSPEEEQGLVEPYKKDLNKPVSAGGWGIKKFNLDDLYVRFFRVAERRIADMTGRGVISFISNHSWISDASFVVMRKHLFNCFDRVWIENLHGNRKISEYAPDGTTSETVFAIRGFSVGIRQGVATSLLVKTGSPRDSVARVLFRDDISAARADARRAQLLDTLKRKHLDRAYRRADPRPENRYSARPESVAPHYMDWPRLVDLAAVSAFNGLMEKRASALIDIDRDKLERRMQDYFDPDLSWEDYRARRSALASDAARFEAKPARKKARALESFDRSRVRRYALRPFDTRWCYYTPVRPVWNEPRPKLWAQCWSGNSFLMSRPSGVALPEGVPFFWTSAVGDNDALRGHAYYIPVRLLNGERLSPSHQATLFDVLGDAPKRKPVANLSTKVREFLRSLGQKHPDADEQPAGLIWHHVLAIGFSPAYLSENADGIRGDWPRIPLPDKRKGLDASVRLGEEVAALLNGDRDVPGVASGSLRLLFRRVCVPRKKGEREIDPNTGDFAVTVGWGHAGKGGVTMPGAGRLELRAFNADELAAIDAEAASRRMKPADLLRLLGGGTCDVFLNADVYWSNVPMAVWNYYIGGYQVVKKWLSYREHKLLGRPLTPEEAREVTAMVRRLTAVVLLGPALDENYRNVKANAYAWTRA